MSLKNNYLEITKKLGGPYCLTKKGIKRGLIDSILQDKDVRISNVMQIADALGVSVEQLITRKKGKRKENTESQQGIEGHENYMFLGTLTDKELIYIHRLIEALRSSDEKGKSNLKNTLDTFLKKVRKKNYAGPERRKVICRRKSFGRRVEDKLVTAYFEFKKKVE